MIVLTKYLGEMKIDEANIIHFSGGLPGFLEETKFILLDLPGNPLFQFLQSIQTPDLAFIVTDPYHYYQDYQFELDEQILTALQIESEKEVMVRAIITLKEPFTASTMNLKAPVVINPISKAGKQFILNKEQYEAKTPILPKGGE
ncbi:flagellar assembly protein FliW [Ornithinibacillus sp. 4-3]|uniref:Flagellar assembly factor FliW n=1 Tax=Ornithinibacillus sp. 4-3 TaxID=3231488 RepID=A0AB39HT63_9BACI